MSGQEVRGPSASSTPPAAQVTVLSAVPLGYFLTEPLLPAEFRVPDHAVPG